LESIDGLVDDIWVYDSRWIGVEYYSNFSTDETDKIVLKFARHAKSRVHLGFMPVLHQYEARSRAFLPIPEGDWIFILDSDECVKTWTFDKSRLDTTTIQGFRICFRIPDEFTAYPTARLFKKTKGMRITFDHRWLADDEHGKIDPWRVFPVTTDIVIDNHELADEKKKMRPVMNTYEAWLSKWENEQDGRNTN